MYLTNTAPDDLDVFPSIAVLENMVATLAPLTVNTSKALSPRRLETEAALGPQQWSWTASRLLWKKPAIIPANIAQLDIELTARYHAGDPILQYTAGLAAADGTKALSQIEQNGPYASAIPALAAALGLGADYAEYSVRERLVTAGKIPAGKSTYNQSAAHRLSHVAVLNLTNLPLLRAAIRAADYQNVSKHIDKPGFGTGVWCGDGSFKMYMTSGVIGCRVDLEHADALADYVGGRVASNNNKNKIEEVIVPRGMVATAMGRIIPPGVPTHMLSPRKLAQIDAILRDLHGN